jgi:hypothetical protein
MKRWLPALLVLVALAGGGWLYGSPWLTLQEMRQAAEARDADGLAAHIDYPALRKSMKAELRARASGAHGPLGMLVASGLADTLVDAALTPEGMRAIFVAAPLASRSDHGPGGMKASDMRVQRERWNRFILVKRDGGPGALVFELEGIRWKLTAIRLPPGAL